MEEIRALLAGWEEEGLASGANIEKAYLILELLTAKVEQLDAQLNG